MLRFHANLYARPAGLAVGSAILLRETPIRPLEWSDPDRVFRRPLPLSFEVAIERLAGIQGIDVEPDGFFIATAVEDEIRWRVSGQLFEFDQSLHRVTLHGDCPSTSFDRLIECFSNPTTGASQIELVYELIEEGVVLCDQEFRRWAAAA